MFSSIAILAFILLSYYMYRKNETCLLKMPSGPNGVPIFGNLFQVLINPHLKFSKWAQKYGSVYTLNILGRPALVVNDVKAMRQVFGTLESTGKFTFHTLEIFSEGKNGIFSGEGKEWQEVRAFTMKALKDCGIGKSSVVEPAVWQSCEEISKWFEEESKISGVVYPLREKFIDAMSNILWSIVSRDNAKSDTGKLVAKTVDGLQRTAKSGLIFLPWLRYIFPEWTGYNFLLQACSKLHAQVHKYFDERKLYRKRVQVQPEDRTLLDAYLDQMENCTDPNSVLYGEVGWKHCFHSMNAVLVAGGETTATTLNWLVNYLVAYPSVQQKIYEELKKEIGNRLPVLTDRKRLPYLEAVIYETMRMSSLLPFGIIHMLLDNVKFENYDIPKNTLLFANMYHVHNNPAVWGDPENFRPTGEVFGGGSFRKWETKGKCSAISSRKTNMSWGRFGKRCTNVGKCYVCTKVPVFTRSG